MSVYMYSYTFIYTRMWVYTCTRVDAFCLFVLSNISATCACITGVSNICMRVCGVLEVGVFPASSWLALVPGVGPSGSGLET